MALLRRVTRPAPVATRKEIEKAGGFATALPDGRLVEAFASVPTDNLVGKELVVFFSGMGSTGALLPLHPDVQRWCQEHDVILLGVSLPAHGHTDDHESRKLSEYHKDVEQVLVEMRWPSTHKFHVMGLSLGGPHAMEVASALPDRIKSVTLVSTYAPKLVVAMYNPMYRLLVKLIGQSVIPHLMSYALAKNPQIILDNAPDFKEVSSEWQQRIADDMRRCVSRSWKFYGSSTYLLGQDWGFEVSTLRSHVSVYAGDQDRMVDPENAARLAQLIPNASLHILEGEGHFTFFNHWRSILAEVIAHR